MTGLRSIRALKPDSLRGVEPAHVGKAVPRFEWVDPSSLFVEEGYQRHVGESGITLVRKIYAGFSWARFKPPVCVRLEGSATLVCIDGQHTAIAAASHPKIGKIPVMIVPAQDADPAQDAKHRAAAFVGHNRDRVALTPPAIYRAELASGDELAGTVDRACRTAAVTVLDKSINLRDRQPVGTTIAIGTLKSIAKRHGEDFLVRTLRVLVAANRGPIKAAEMDATATILIGAGARPALDLELNQVISSKTAEAWAAIGAAKAAETGEPIGSAVASAWCRALGIRLSKGPGRQIMLRTRAERAGTAPPSPEKAAERLTPPPTPKPTPQPAPAPPAPAPAPAPVPSPTDQVVRRNGIEVDLQTGTLTHRNTTVRIPKTDGVRMVAALLRVMPALLDPTRLASKTFPEAPSQERLRDLIAFLAPVLATARLEIKAVGKVGFSLFDLGR